MLIVRKGLKKGLLISRVIVSRETAVTAAICVAGYTPRVRFGYVGSF
jgi:hypothetical protein